MSNLNELRPIDKVQNIIDKFCYTIGMIPTSYKLSLTYEEQILSIGKYLEETVIPALNNNAEAVLELQNLYIELKNYVDNYFKDLDVQDEIDKKLDEMVKNGTIQNIIDEKIFKNINNNIAKNSINIAKNTVDIQNKISKNENNSISLNMLSQEVKESMTGGSVPVVGENSISNINIVNNSIDYLKLDNFLQNNLQLNYKKLDDISSKTSGFYIIGNENKLTLLEPSSTYYFNYKLNLEKGKIYCVNCYNISDLKGIFITDNNLNVIATGENLTNIDGSLYTTSLLFKCNRNDLTLITQTQRTIVVNNVEYCLLNNFRGVYEINSINNILSNFPKIYKENLTELFKIDGSYIRYNMPYQIRGTENSFLHIYKINKNENYIINSNNIYEMSGFAIYDNNFNLLYNSSNSYTNKTIPVSLEYYAENDGFIAISELSNSSYSIEKYVPYPLENYNNKLSSKKLCFVGDSICYNFGGYAQQIQNKTDCFIQNLAVNGATISKYNKTKSCIAEQILNISNPDIILVEGGINDYWLNVELGNFDNTDYTNELDLSTFSGGLESIFRYCYNNYPTIPLFFVIQHKIKNTSFRNNNKNLTYEDYYKRIIDLCKKYCVQVIDIYKNVNFNTEFSNLSLNYTTNDDGTHPTVNGYNLFYTNYIINKLNERL